MSKSLNVYGDQLVENSGRGSDIASQRMDELDREALDLVHEAAATGSAPAVLDAGAGRCGHANRMAAAGAIVHAVDFGPYAEYADSGTLYHRMGILEFLRDCRIHFDVVYCQRTLHYFRFDEAIRVLSLMHEKLRSGGRLLISASGLSSELGDGYTPRESSLSHRFGYLAENMQAKHKICEPVCLYTLDELQQSIAKVGFSLLGGFESEFGNVKVIAEKR